MPLRKILVILFALLLVFTLGAYSLAPPFEQVHLTTLGSDRVLLDQEGHVIQTLRTDFTKRRLAWRPLKDFPETLRQAVIASEDQRFYHHPGVDPAGLARAAWAMVRGHHRQGASTITMQVADLIQDDVLKGNQPIRKGSALHKGLQIMRAFGLEFRWSKAQILEAYLNLIHLRGEFQGVPAASLAYLNKDPLALDENEAPVIAAMISSPNQSATSLKARACALRKRIAGKDTPCAALENAAMAFFQGSPSLPATLGHAPHLARRLFQANRQATVIQSTLDGALQTAVAAILEKNIQHLSASNVHDSAAIVIENRTGRVLAYVGAVSGSESPAVDGVQAYRQAGSSLKPFLYGKAIEEKRLTAASILLDDPTAISWGGEVYRPSNYDKHFFGPVSVREALGSSLNVPAVKTVTILGLHDAYRVLQSIHLTNLKEPDYYGVSLALGAVEVRLEDLANAYRIFANQGEWSPLRYGEEKAAAPEPVYSAAASYIIGSILSDPNARSIGFGWESPLETPFWTAVKTGTSKDYRDNWCVGFSELYTVAVWAGNYNAEAMNKVSGVSGAGPAWYDIMMQLHHAAASKAPAMPDTVVAKKIRHDWASSETNEYFVKGTEPTGSVIETSLVKQIQFVFPAEGSVLVKDPHLDQNQIALFVRFKGTLPSGARIRLDGHELGPARSPFKIASLPTGKHELSIVGAQSVAVAQVHFLVHGGD